MFNTYIRNLGLELAKLYDEYHYDENDKSILSLQQYPTITFMKYAVRDKTDTSSDHKFFSGLYDSVRDEPVSSILISMLDMLHEELMLARKNNVLWATCIEGCKYVGVSA